MLIFMGSVFSQVGINTDSPQSTLDVRGVNHNGAVTANDGVLVPRVSSLSVSGSQNGQLVYLIGDVGSTYKGGFHYWDGSVWTPINTNDGDAWGVSGENQTNTVSRTGNVGIGGTPNTSAILDLQASDKALLVPRVALTGSNDVSTVPSPTNGMLVYATSDAQLNTSNEVKKDNFYYFNETANKWSLMIQEDSLSEALGKLKIPKLAGYMYSVQSQPLSQVGGGINVVDFSNSYSDFGTAMTLSANNEFLINETGKYAFDGFANLLLSVSGETYWTVAVQVKASAAAPWGNANDLALGMRCLYVDYATDLTQPCNFSGAMSLTQGNMIRLVVLKKNGATPVYGNLGRSMFLGVPYAAGFKAMFIPD